MNSTTGFLRHLPVIVIATALFYLSSIPEPPAPDFGFEFSDKINHVAAYTLFGLALWISVHDLFHRQRFGTQLAIVFVGTMMYGISDEIHQAFVPGRQSGIDDVIADAVGGMIACTLVWIIMQHRKRKNGNSESI